MKIQLVHIVQEITTLTKTVQRKMKRIKIAAIIVSYLIKKHNINKTSPNHSATSQNCPRIILLLDRLRNKINYGP